jgi:O-antigen ligase
MVAIVLFNLFLYSQDKHKRWLYLLLLIPGVIHLIFSFTRGYWFGFIGGLVFSYAYYVSQQEYALSRRVLYFLKGLTIISLLSVSILLTLQLLLPGGNFIRVFARRAKSSFSVTLSRETVSNYARVLEYQGAIERIKEKPVYGFGLGYRFEIFNPLLSQRETIYEVHNDYIDLILKMGLIGLIVYLWLFYVFFKEGLQTGKRLNNPLAKSLTAGFLANVLQILLIGFTNHVLIGVMNIYYLAFAMGAIVVINAGKETKVRS